MDANKITKIKYVKGFYILKINGNDYSLNEWYYQNILPYEGKVLDVKTMIELIAFASASKELKPLYKKVFNHTLSTYEFKGKLLEKNIDSDKVNLIAARFKEEGYLNDEEFVSYYKEIYEQNKGIKAFENFLYSKKIRKTLIDEALADYHENEEYALDYASSYIAHQTGSLTMIKIKVKQHLIAKGFSEELIESIMKELVFKEEDESLLKELRIYEKKYPNDYYKLLEKLYNKGYKIDKIKECLKKEGISNEN